jgi:hypothetical protein
MKEFLLLIRAEGDYCEAMPPELYKAHIKKVGNCIDNLLKAGKLKGAQPLGMDGMMLSNDKKVFKDGPFIESKEVIVGYFHILAKDLSEAREIAMANPVFEDTDARIEIRAVKNEEGVG